MSEACTELDARLEAVAKAAAPLGSRLPRVRDPATACWMAHAMDALLRNVTSGYDALDVALGEGLDALSVGRRAMDLSYSNIGDYAREELGINASTAVKMARLARRLRERPALREAVRRGELSARKAEIIAPVAVGGDQVRWILRAKGETVRSLKVAVKAPADSDEEEWVNLRAEVSPESWPKLDEGLRAAGVILGASATKKQRVAVWGEEYLGSHPAPADEHADDVLFAPEDDLERLKELLEQESRQWAALATVAQRIALEHSLYRIPLLRRALREKRISYEKARVIARHAEGEEVQGWIEKAETMTCVELRRAMQDKDEAQMCARGTFSVWMPVSVAEVVKASFRAARAAAKRWLSAGDCLVTLAEHFVDTWRALLEQANTLQRRIRVRDRHFCQVPGCSRAAVHAHHIKPRSQGGSDDPENLISLCALCRARHKAHYAGCRIMPTLRRSPSEGPVGYAA